MNGLVNLLMTGMLGIVPDIAIENSNILGYHERHQTTDYNRLRGDLTLEQIDHPDIIAKLIVDNETAYTSRPSERHNDASIYRAYLQYGGTKHFWSLGKQRIPLGVGRIWNPIDIFNPINSEAIESAERPGTNALRYEYAISELSNVDTTLAKGQGELRIKGYLEIADVALIGLWDEEGDQNIIGWEFEGQLLETGIELRSEGGGFYQRSTTEWHSELIIGAEYGFANSLTLLAEYNFSDESKIDYIAGMASYQPAMLVCCSLLVLTNLDDHSGFITPNVEYSLSDEMNLSVGAYIYNGSATTEFGLVANRYYLRWFVHF